MGDRPRRFSIASSSATLEPGFRRATPELLEAPPEVARPMRMNRKMTKAPAARSRAPVLPMLWISGRAQMGVGPLPCSVCLAKGALEMSNMSPRWASKPIAFLARSERRRISASARGLPSTPSTSTAAESRVMRGARLMVWVTFFEIS